MASDAWKTVERTVAAILGGVRSWESDHDVLVVTGGNPVVMYEAPGMDPRTLIYFQKQGQLELASVEVKNLKAPTVAQLELFLALNQRKIDRDMPGATNALVIKRKAGAGRSTPYLLVMPITADPSS
jgi:hypothetical protein